MVRQFYFAGPLVDAAEQIIGPNLKAATSQLTFKTGGNRMVFPWHQDNGYGELEPYNAISCLTALDDIDLENGCLWVIPGSNRTGQQAHASGKRAADGKRGTELLAQADESKAVPVPMRAGESLVMSCWTLHKSGPNRPGPRPAHPVLPLRRCRCGRGLQPAPPPVGEIAERPDPIRGGSPVRGGPLGRESLRQEAIKGTELSTKGIHEEQEGKERVHQGPRRTTKGHQGSENAQDSTLEVGKAERRPWLDGISIQQTQGGHQSGLHPDGRLRETKLAGGQRCPRVPCAWRPTARWMSSRIRRNGLSDGSRAGGAQPGIAGHGDLPGPGAARALQPGGNACHLARGYSSPASHR